MTQGLICDSTLLLFKLDSSMCFLCKSVFDIKLLAQCDIILENINLSLFETICLIKFFSVNLLSRIWTQQNTKNLRQKSRNRRCPTHQ